MMACLCWSVGFSCRKGNEIVLVPRLTNISKRIHCSPLKRSLKRYQLCKASEQPMFLCSCTKSSQFTRKNRVCFLVADANVLSRSSRNESPSNLVERLSILKNNFERFHYFIVSEDSVEEVERHISTFSAIGLKPEVIITYGGAQIFQLGFREPDPLWEQQVLKEWEPKPVQTLVESTLLEAEIGYLECRKTYSSEFPLSSMPKIPLVLRYTFSEDIKLGHEALISLLSQKLRENGLKASIRRTNRGRSFDICSSTVTSIGAFEFICSMLKIDEDNRVTLLFGDSPSIYHMNRHLKASLLCPSFDDLENVLSKWMLP
ncbi:hypothetical protein GpartN1_g557.t1 [Galdieria partita]|uniref:Sucrose phosphatase-like domain-containing protein n=1 Tax=Galdieria partita TaxID=83374 RepID=A0A9C7PQY1_9RHOD|nr:hypothetical protein GpartN1_g557.t1 [Galdieria partita]